MSSSAAAPETAPPANSKYAGIIRDPKLFPQRSAAPAGGAAAAGNSRRGSATGSGSALGTRRSATGSSGAGSAPAAAAASSSTRHRPWLETRNQTVQHVQSAAGNCAWVGKASAELRQAIQKMEAENAMMEEVLSEPHHIVSNNDLALIMRSVLQSATDSNASAIMHGRKPPVLRSLMRARGERLPPDRSGTEYLPFASSAVPYAALQLEQNDMIQRNKERHSVYQKMVLDVERQQRRLEERWGSKS
jgi:hypothetical protein